ncbi:MAG: DUF5602 domain-containing protein [Phycisphaerae bacterium]|nr:DUF5602 domain-containing protein [Gemmatimonadaceae bacterium]
MSLAIVLPPMLHRSAVVVTLIATALTSSACGDDSTSPNQPRTSYGATQTLGGGTARTYVTLNESGKPTSIGVALSEAALTNLPQTPNAPSPSAVMLQLALPADAPVTGYNHVMLDWNPQGHEPDHMYTHPHFDFHFYSVTPQQVMAIMPTDPQWAAKAGALPAAQFVPTGYKAASVLAGIPAAAAAAPMMGLHWLEVASPELQPPPAGKTFTETFIYGSYDGKFIFLEPMITKAYLESLRNTTGMSRNIGTPAQVGTAGYYPSSYSSRYDATAKEYRIALENLAHRQ